jgi:hypothetical protein
MTKPWNVKAVGIILCFHPFVGPCWACREVYRRTEKKSGIQDPESR